MTIASQMQRIINAKSAIRTAIIDKGVEVPDTEKIDTYHEYIDQISATKPPTGDGTLDDLKLALSTDDPAGYYPIGTELEDTYNGHSNPLIVAQYLKSSNNRLYGNAEGVILIRKYVEPTSQIFGDYGTVDFGSSTLKTFLGTTYYDNCSNDLKKVLSNITIRYRNGTSTYGTSVVKFFPMSPYEVCCDADSSYSPNEGIMWDYWKKQTGLTSPDALYKTNSGRIMRNSSGAANLVWLRSWITSSKVGQVSTSGAIQHAYANANSTGVLPACFIAKGDS